MTLFRRHRSCLSAAVLMAVSGTAAHAQSRIECAEVPSRILNAAVPYCAFLPPGYHGGPAKAQSTGDHARRYPVLYYLHGLGDSERSLVDTGGWNLIQDLREKRVIGDFLIVTPQGGRSFYVNSFDGRVRYGDFLLREFIPAIERRYRVDGRRSARGIMGISMGGYGALRLAFAHPQLFASVSAHSAALMPESPAELNVAMRSGFGQAGLLGDVFGNPIDVPFWRQNNPLVLARRNASEIKTLHIYFDCGDEDNYGFDLGARKLHEELKSENIPHEFHLYPGRHDLVYFLQHLGASVQFHSRVFEQQRKSGTNRGASRLPN